MNTDQLRTEIDKLVQAGDAQGLERFVFEHFKDLPEDAQEAMLLSAVQDAIANRAADAKIAELQEKSLQALADLAREQTA